MAQVVSGGDSILGSKIESQILSVLCRSVTATMQFAAHEFRLNHTDIEASWSYNDNVCAAVKAAPDGNGFIVNTDFDMHCTVCEDYVGAKAAYKYKNADSITQAIWEHVSAGGANSTCRLSAPRQSHYHPMVKRSDLKAYSPDDHVAPQQAPPAARPPAQSARPTSAQSGAAPSTSHHVIQPPPGFPTEQRLRCISGMLSTVPESEAATRLDEPREPQLQAALVAPRACAFFNGRLDSDKQMYLATLIKLLQDEHDKLVEKRGDVL